MESLSRNSGTPETAQAKYFITDGSNLEVYEKLPLSFQNLIQIHRKESEYAKCGSVLNQDVCLITVAESKLDFCLKQSLSLFQIKNVYSGGQELLLLNLISTFICI